MQSYFDRQESTFYGRWFARLLNLLCAVAAIVTCLEFIGCQRWWQPPHEKTVVVEAPVKVYWNKGDREYKLNDPFSLTVAAQTDVLLYVFYIDQTETAFSLFPDDPHKTRVVQAGKAAMISRIGASGIFVDSTKGAHLLIAAVSCGKTGTLPSDRLPRAGRQMPPELSQPLLKGSELQETLKRLKNE